MQQDRIYQKFNVYINMFKLNSNILLGNDYPYNNATISKVIFHVKNK